MEVETQAFKQPITCINTKIANLINEILGRSQITKRLHMGFVKVKIILENKYKISSPFTQKFYFILFYFILPRNFKMRNSPKEIKHINLHKLESRLLGEISITSDMQITQPLWQKVKRN